MSDLWDFLPPATVDGNYVTRKVYQWIACDPSVEYRCRQCARQARSRGGSDAQGLLAIGLRVLIARHGLAAESKGLFFEIFTRDLQEVDWYELARFYLEVLAKE